MHRKNQHRETEVRFLEIDKLKLGKRLHSLGAKDLGEILLEEVICYDKDLVWRDSGNSILRVRNTGTKVVCSYKERPQGDTIDGTVEYELEAPDTETALLFLASLGYIAYRHQQKLRHTFTLDGVTIDIDTWPNVPPYVELEGEDVRALQCVASKLDLPWSKAVTDNPRKVLEERYGIPVGTMTWFTFDRCE